MKWLTNKCRTRSIGFGGVIILTVSITAYCLFQSDRLETRILDNKEIAMINMVMNKPEDRYFNYYSFSLPEQFTPAPEMFMIVHGSRMVKISIKQQYYPSYEQFINRYKDQLLTTDPVNPKNSPFLKQVYDLEPAMKGVIFERMEDPGYHDSFRVLDSFKWERNVTFSVMTKATDGRSDKYNKDRAVYGDILNYNVPEKKNQTIKLLAGLKPRRDNEKPQGKNIAIQYGQIDPSLLGEYEITVNYRNNLDININFNTDTGPSLGKKLLSTDSREIEGVDGKTLYKGNRKINDLDVSEWLIREQKVSEGMLITDYNFTLRAHEDRANGESPLEINMMYSSRGKKNEDLLNESELIDIWEKITDTLEYHQKW